MSQVGEITVRCDMRHCHAEQSFGTSALAAHSLQSQRQAHGWKYDEHVGDVCPDCVEEAESRQR